MQTERDGGRCALEGPLSMPDRNLHIRLRMLMKSKGVVDVHVPASVLTTASDDGAVYSRPLTARTTPGGRRTSPSSIGENEHVRQYPPKICGEALETCAGCTCYPSRKSATPPVAVREYHELRHRESLEAMQRRIDVSHKAGAYDIDYKKT